ncbi:MAG: hypothetical protein Q9M26_07770 [Mariprofundales bacterium]|nr:hypothetical protein [Mariprofundales bacterium]
MAKRWNEMACALHPDNKGMVWDLVLYVPTVGFLLLWGLKLWYGGEDQVYIGYGLMFLGFFFLMVGGNRVLRRMLLMPSSPLAIDVNQERIKLKLKSGEDAVLVKDVRFFSDYAGKSFALTGIDGPGAKRQFVFHRQQFDAQDVELLLKALEGYK